MNPSLARLIGGGRRDDPGPKRHRDGTHRTCAPADTLARIAPRMASMGITRIANVTGLDRIGVPVVMVTRPNARSLAVSQGKGLDLDAARASGLMEAVEAYHAERIELPLKLGSLEDMVERHPVAAIDDLPRVAGDRFRPDLATLWAEALDLASDAMTWLPYETVHANFTLPLPPGSGCFVCGTNGLASGNHLLEAVCHGLCEVIERDATALWHRREPAGRAATRVDLATIDDPLCTATIARIEAADMALALWETATDIGVATYRCMIVDTRDETPHVGVGAGCHPARDVAVLRAVTEAVQVRTTYVTGTRDDLMAEEFGAATLAARRREGLRLLDDPATRDFGAAPDFAGDTFADDLDWLLARLAAAGVSQVLSLDLGRPEVDCAVARVVVPGLEAPDDDEDYVPGPRAQDPEAHVP